MKLPRYLQHYIDGHTVTENSTGMTQARILQTDELVIKIEAYHDESKREYEILKFLQGVLPVPTLIDYYIEHQISYIVMSKIKGSMAFDEPYISSPKTLIKLLANAIKALWSVKITSCPIQNKLTTKLKTARFRIDHNLIENEEIDYWHLQSMGIESVEGLYQWLVDHQIEDEIVFTHGDFCLPNVLFYDNILQGYIDLGRAGVADKYQDIALCARSLSYNLDVPLDDPIIQEFLLEFNPTIKWEKINYYILLDELF